MTREYAHRLSVGDVCHAPDAHCDRYFVLRSDCTSSRNNERIYASATHVTGWDCTIYRRLLAMIGDQERRGTKRCECTVHFIVCKKAKIIGKTLRTHTCKKEHLFFRSCFVARHCTLRYTTLSPRKGRRGPKLQNSLRYDCSSFSKHGA